ncbi:GNAT family N-acetyltransferase [Anaerocolumna sp. MB42-C2]|uniref:GNAT family N-acetyltransferase n=1 Tax=Anaerocolumna sp. MB42-C2 TaxID=3070997 RepID=UPI0027DFEF7F|nr:GNAT family protein [Anaerocolumna sp. MB42-C2]WMJ87430.1 GNAT family protein [Anaerocolumna sp. MB42-C2]
MIEIKTERLRVRSVTINDFTKFVDLEGRLESYQYESSCPLSLEDSKRIFDKYITDTCDFPNSGSAMLSIIDGQDLFAGEIHIKCNWAEMKEWEIGYKLLKEFWNNGYATEAVKAVAIYLFEQIQIHKLIAFANSDNMKSEHVLQRIGMKKEGHLREARIVNGEYKDELVYAMLKCDLTENI